MLINPQERLATDHQAMLDSSIVLGAFNLITDLRTLSNQMKLGHKLCLLIASTLFIEHTRLAAKKGVNHRVINLILLLKILAYDF